MDALHEIAVQPHLWIVPLAAVLSGGFGFLWWFGFARWFPGEYSRKYPDERFPWSGWSIVAIIWWVVAGLVFVAYAAMLIPFQSRYHVLYHVDGTVQSVSNTFESGSGAITSSPVVRLDTLDRAAVVSDPRVLDLVDQDVTLLCSIGWVPYGMDRLNCSIADIK